MEKLHSKDIDLGLDRFQALLSRLGNPQDQLPPVIHVAGTNAKGSTIAFLQSFFETVGYRVHSFTSPHLVRPHECINLKGHEIDEETFSSLLQEVIQANEGAPLTVFEAISATAFLAFSRIKAHVILLETGLGGTGDTTNVVKAPALSVLTPISYDHQEFLGDTLGEIASQKAGILKKNVPCVMAKQDEEAYQAIRERIKELEIDWYREGREWFVKKAGKQMVFEGWDGDSVWPRPNLAGDHQINNAGLALACIEVLKDQFNLPREAITNAMGSVYWPGRLERVEPDPFLKDSFELWLDGGHNEAAAQALRTQIKKWNDRPLYIIHGMMKRKNSKAFLQKIAGLADHVYCVPIPDQPAKKPEKLAGQVQEAGGLATACEDLQLAFDLIKAERDKPARVLLCGSLYLLGAFYDLQGCA
ncbi:Folylpolyglutamate synthase [Candidatus Terasakiella magnetica]|uniref:Dihydrofolate synthase/folylpolyglutamate synthase n=1 Tax=Candidatus Terasakiella magnetica TaxID=1867952 RepID=A0A1C3RIK8_9PROT|nr:folylpolyglutamate synthase/dihydrofolate synthase family protein [Candidatus Terasakiella magnetica]SCA57089.1 Folylpolyglutamate synthase [Candidatus Terasakiella magnetica]